MKNKAVFLDRDGTINYDPGYLSHPELFEIVEGVPHAIKQLNEASFKIFVITNQSGVARGRVSEENLRKIHEKMIQEFEKTGARIDGIYYCPHHPDEVCSCRKPSPEMIFRAAEDHQIDIEHSYVIGDKQSDLDTGRNAGCRAVILVPGAVAYQLGEISNEPDFYASDMDEAVTWILSQEKKESG